MQSTEDIVEYELHGEPYTSEKLNERHYRLKLAQPTEPLNDITLRYTHKNFNKPIVTVSPDAAIVSFVPDSNTAAIEERQMEVYEGDYVFLLDRSGSMCGQRIEQARKSLVLFLKSLPPNSKFNVISFGSKFEFMYPESQNYEDNIVTKAIETIARMDADMGGTEIAQPLNQLYSMMSKSKFSPNVFIITDGQVNNTEEIIQIIKSIRKDKGGRVHMIGIGNGISVDMIKRGAQYGGGKHIFIQKEATMKQEIIGLLTQVVLPLLSNVELIYDKELIAEITDTFVGGVIDRKDHTKVYLRFR